MVKGCGVSWTSVGLGGALTGALLMAGCVGEAPPPADENAGQSVGAGRVRVCHVDDGGIVRELVVSENALDAHRRHGDHTPVTYYADADRDGYGDAASSVSVCTQPSGYVTNDDDCNDAAAAVRPGASESCNGVDDNCNGTRDEDVTRTCYTGPSGTLNVGVCLAGSQACVVGGTGTWGACTGQVLPAAEACNGRDDDCNGLADDGNPGGDLACATGQSGVCAAGTTACTAGVVVCNRNVEPSAETCNGRDDNCDGTTDEDNPGGGLACATGQSGVCAAGTTACTAGAVVCNRNVEPSAEACNGADDNCDGTVDEGNPGGGTACATGQSGVCAAGTTACAGGAVVCNRNTEPSTEACNGADDDCDGATDDGAASSCTAGPNATATCAMATCGLTCTAGFGNCDGVAANGCETNLNTSGTHCGACGAACTAGQSCQAGQCMSVGNSCTASAIPFAPEANTGTAGPGGDDHVINGIALGFSFRFFGTTYTTVNISSNGLLGFGASTPDGCCSGRTIPSNDSINNIIATSWTDLFPPGGGNIRYETRGTAPNRRFVVSYNDLPWYPESTPRVRAQIILHETSNRVEIHTTYQAIGHTYTQGVENASGAVACSLPGRVAASYSLSNDGVAFTTN